MNTSIYAEISRELPDIVPDRFLAGGVPLFTAFGCVLIERCTGRSFVYRALNLKTWRSVTLCRRAIPMSGAGAAAMADKIRTSPVAGPGRLTVDRPTGESLPYEKLRAILNEIFRDILPQYGYSVREQQIELAEHMLGAIRDRAITLAEAEVGTGKTFAYLAAALMSKRGRMNDFWNQGFFPGASCVSNAHMPIVIATSSIALQKALIQDFIPVLSEIFMTHGIITEPLTAALRKGKEHYACDRKLLENRPGLDVPLDLAELDGLTPYNKRMICVPERCPANCPQRDCCRYLYNLEQAQSNRIDIQVCNHQYLLADAKRRAAGQRPLIPNYQCLIIDEAHKFLDAARSMYGMELSRDVLTDQLADQGRRLFRSLAATIAEDADDEAERYTVQLTPDVRRHLHNIRNIAGERTQKDAEKAAAAFLEPGDLICWLERGGADASLHAMPKDIDKKLFSDLWSRGVPTILTSGTLSAGGDFSRMKQTLGLDSRRIRLTETTKLSPFNHMENKLLYLSKAVPFPDNRSAAYINAVADECERLIRIAHGHTAVLFTSYKVMDKVWERLAKRGLKFPFFRLDRGGVSAIEKFKQDGKGVLFASGALWEGIDIPGDALSMLIIVKLPFQAPDPISEWERAQHGSMERYRREVLEPDCAVKLKQGDGRGLRIETDTCVTAILDLRAAEGWPYNRLVLNTLAACPVTSGLGDVDEFFCEKKGPSYWGLKVFPNWEYDGEAV